MPTNKERAESAFRLIKHFDQSGVEPLETVTVDILTNFMHLCNEYSLPFDNLLRMARIHHGEEIGLAYVKLSEPTPGDIPGPFWTCLYSNDDGEEVEVVQCAKRPTFGQVIAQFEHLQESVNQGFLVEEDMSIQPYTGIPVIDPTSAPFIGETEDSTCEEIKASGSHVGIGKSVLIEGIIFPSSTKDLHACDSCNWAGTEPSAIKDEAERVDEGGKKPSGECPKCGSLCYHIGVQHT